MSAFLIDDSPIHREVVESLASALPQPTCRFEINWRQLSTRLADQYLPELFSNRRETTTFLLVQGLHRLIDNAFSSPASALQRSVEQTVSAHLTWATNMNRQLEQSFGTSIDIIEPGWGDCHAPGLTTSRVKTSDGRIYFAKPGRKPRTFDYSELELEGSENTNRDVLVLDGATLYPERVADSVAAVSSSEFWFDAGRFLSLALAGGFSDGHYQNVIAVDGRVAVIDDETIGNPQVLSSQRVEDTLLLESRAGASGVLVGAFVAQSRHIRSRTRPVLIQDGLSVRLEQVSTSIAMRCPLSDVYGTVSSNPPVFLEGFAEGQRRYAGLTRQDFANSIGARLVIRPTTVYTKIIERARRIPDTVSDARRIEWCASILRQLPAFKYEFSLCQAEAVDLAKGWVPRFTYSEPDRLEAANGTRVRLTTPLIPNPTPGMNKPLSSDRLRSWLTQANLR